MKSNSSDSRRAKAMLTLSRIVVYIILIFLSILCLFSFYMLIINSTRTNADLQGGFKFLPQGNFLTNFKNAWNAATTPSISPESWQTASSCPPSPPSSPPISPL